MVSAGQGTRPLGWGAALALAAVLAAAPAAAEKQLELSPQVREKLVVLHDGRDHYVVVDPFGPSDTFYYGDGKRFSQQRVFGHYRDQGGGSATRRFWSPQSENHGDLELARGKWTVRCDDRVTPLAILDERETAKLLVSAKFFAPKWERRAYALARDDDGRYYYVDKLRDPYARGYRLFVGKRGAMKELPLTDVVSDSSGDIFATRGGDLRITRTRAGAEVQWAQGKRTLELVDVPVEKNAVLIYADLGVYRDHIGTPCDDF